jgi:GABA(A) receptor-associated protein
MFVIRKRLKLPPEQGIYLFVKGVIPPSSAMLNVIYEEHKDPGNFPFLKFNNGLIV